MLGGRQRSMPTARSEDMYSERLNSSLTIYNAEPEVPATSYAITPSTLRDNYRTPVINPKVRAFFKSNFWNLGGIFNFWSWGKTDMAPYTHSLPYGGGMDGTVRSTMFQTENVLLHDWSQYTKLRQAGWNATGGGFFTGSNPIRYTYPSFRVPQIDTRTSGGPGPVGTRMQVTPRFTAVQRVPKYTAPVRYYQTRSRARTKGTGGSSNTNKTTGT